MEAVRCLRCGETRWTLFRASLNRLETSPCEACGGPTVLERRRPGAAPRRPFVERRDRITAQPSRLTGTGT
jgi:hypothetical protein